MEITRNNNHIRMEQFLGLAILILPEEELENLKQWTETNKQFDIIQINNPTREAITRTQTQGFIYKPQFLFWTMDTPQSEEEYFSLIGCGQRKNFRVAIDYCRQAKIVSVQERELKKGSFEQWLPLYRQTIAQFDMGTCLVDESKYERDGPLLSGVFIFKNQEMLGGNIIQRYEDGRFVARFRGVHREYRHLSRFLDLKSIELARQMGYPKFCLGTDPNLYGYHVSPGIYLYKKHLGLRPEPKRNYEPQSPDILERIIHFDKFGDLVFRLAYMQSEKYEGILHFRGECRPTTVAEFKSPYINSVRTFTM